MNVFKRILVAFVVGAILGAGVVLYFSYHPASATIADLRAESERAVEQYRAEVTEYSDLLAAARGRVEELAESFATEEADHQRSIDRVGRLEDRIRELESIGLAESEAYSRALEYNRSIGDEAAAALRELREYSAAFAGSLDDSGKKDSQSED